MKKILFSLAICSAHLGFAQVSVDNYIFKVENGKTYTPLTSGTNITSGFLWDQENFKIPMGFTADIGGKTTSYFSFSAGYGFGPGSDTAGVANSFVPFYGSDLLDRGWASGSDLSPLRYVVSGTTPNRIFKFEVANAGFYDEGDLYGTLDDSVSYQMWVYETSNIVELRYGPSKITHPADYFYFGGAPVMGYFKNFDLDGFAFDKVYYFTGSASAPTIDSSTATSDVPTTISSYPASGTVYRFVPKAVAASIGEIDITGQFSVYPTIATHVINVDQNSAATATISVVNISGQTVLSPLELKKGTNAINVSTLASGVYLLQLNTNEGNATYKFTKQ